MWCVGFPYVRLPNSVQCTVHCLQPDMSTTQRRTWPDHEKILKYD